MEQRQIFINNLAIRRATEELKVARNYEQLCRILVAAFGTNDFDAFDLSVKLLPNDNPGLELVQAYLHRHELCFGWSKSDKLRLRDSLASWNLTLDLVTTSNRRRGSMSIQRLYTQRDLQLDVNLLTAVFPVALADALDRVLGQAMQVMSRPEESARLIAAQAG